MTLVMIPKALKGPSLITKVRFPTFHSKILFMLPNLNTNSKLVMKTIGV